MTRHPLGPALERELAAVVGAAHVLTDEERCAGYEVDWTGRHRGRARAVVRPGSTEEVARVLSACHAAAVPVVAQGGNTGLVAGGVPMHGEVVLSLRRLDSIGAVDATASQVTVGAGATLGAVQARVAGSGLEVAIDLAARASATIGGMVATNAGGVRAFRHGDMRRQVAGVEAVLADGRVVGSLVGLPKDNTGYHLPSLLCGSEGTLAVVTGVRLRLEPMRSVRVTALLGTASVADAMAVALALRAGLADLDAAELMLDRGVELVAAHLGVGLPLPGRPAAYLLVEVACPAGDPLADLLGALDALGPLVVADAVAADAVRRRRLWRYREGHSEAVNAVGRPVKLDVSVPLDAVAPFIAQVPAIVAEACPGAEVIPFGHACDGNVHVNVVGVDEPDIVPVVDAVLASVAARGGSISAEHGVGTAKRAWLGLVRSEAELGAFRAIKEALDPRGILNPHVLVPPSPERPTR